MKNYTACKELDDKALEPVVSGKNFFFRPRWERGGGGGGGGPENLDLVLL